VASSRNRIPHYSTLSRHQQTLEVQLPRSSHGIPKHLMIDSTGLKIYGEGERKVRQHGISKRRTWRKLHVAVDAQTQEVVAVELTANFVGDAEVLPDLLDQLDDTESADGAYDTAQCHQTILNKGARALIPPREGGVKWPDDEKGEPHPRTAIVRHCAEMDKKVWKQESGYHQRSLAETAMFRIKGILVTN